MFIPEFLTIAKPWKQPKCPSTGEWIKKRWCIYRVEYYPAMKRNESSPSAETWMDLESVIQDKVSQKEKTKHFLSTHICGI